MEAWRPAYLPYHCRPHHLSSRCTASASTAVRMRMCRRFHRSRCTRRRGSSTTTAWEIGPEWATDSWSRAGLFLPRTLSRRRATPDTGAAYVLAACLSACTAVKYPDAREARRVCTAIDRDRDTAWDTCDRGCRTASRTHSMRTGMPRSHARPCSWPRCRSPLKRTPGDPCATEHADPHPSPRAPN